MGEPLEENLREPSLPLSPALLKELQLFWGEADPEQEMEAFRDRWGGFSPDAWIHALGGEHAFDRFIAMSLLGVYRVAEARPQLQPFLQSTDPMERWNSAFSLALMKEDVAIAPLTTMLTEFLPRSPDQQAWVSTLDWLFMIQIMRRDAARLLSQWDDPALIVIFRQAFQASVEAEAYFPLTSPTVSYAAWSNLGVLYAFQDTLMSILGRKQALGALTGISLPSNGLQIALMNMVLGFCQMEQAIVYKPDLNITYTWRGTDEQKATILDVFATRFGLSIEERNSLFEVYPHLLNGRNDMVLEKSRSR